MKVFFALMAMLASGMAQAGPFGIDMQSFDPVSAGCSKLAKSLDKYECPVSAIPRPIAPFTLYGMSWAPSAGVCHVAAYFPNPRGKTIDDSYAADIQDVVSALIGKYGQPDSNIGAATDVRDWGDNVKLSWEVPSLELTALILNYYSTAELASEKEKQLPSLANYEASLSVYYRRGEFDDCQKAAWKALNTPESQPTARSRELEGGL